LTLERLPLSLKSSVVACCAGDHWKQIGGYVVTSNSVGHVKGTDMF